MKANLLKSIRSTASSVKLSNVMSSVIKKSIFVSALFLFCFTGRVLYSQSAFGIDFSDPHNTEGYIFNNSNDAAGSDAYLKIDPGMFDRIMLTKGLGYTLTIFNPSANRFTDVYDSLVTAFGYENENQDIIPDGIMHNDFTKITLQIFEDKARIIRYWYEEKMNVKLEFTRNNFKVYIAHY